MFVKFLIFSTIFASALAQANDYVYIRNVVSQSVLDVYQGSKVVSEFVQPDNCLHTCLTAAIDLLLFRPTLRLLIMSWKVLIVNCGHSTAPSC